MCNLYSITTNRAAIIALFRAVNHNVGNLPPMPDVFPDYPSRVTKCTVCDWCRQTRLPYLNVRKSIDCVGKVRHFVYRSPIRGIGRECLVTSSSTP
jgi:hypothetical protein